MSESRLHVFDITITMDFEYRGTTVEETTRIAFPLYEDDQGHALRSDDVPSFIAARAALHTMLYAARQRMLEELVPKPNPKPRRKK